MLAEVMTSTSPPARRAAADGMRPFFGFYGGKWRDAIKNYPPPSHQTIVEPFAGSAGYAVRYADLDVVLCEKDPIIACVWEYLIKATPREIRRLPDMPLDGSTVDDLKVPTEAKSLIGFWLNRAASTPRKSPSRWMRDEIRPGSFWGERVRETIAGQVDRIKHWKIHNVSYDRCPVRKSATWFIDPPYEHQGTHYRHGANAIDYDRLALWCQARPGQVIVCENEGADWLPFTLVGAVKTTRRDRRSREVVWIRA